MTATKVGLVVFAAACSAAAMDVPLSCETNVAVCADYVPPAGAGEFSVELPRKTNGPVRILCNALTKTDTRENNP